MKNKTYHTSDIIFVFIILTIFYIYSSKTFEFITNTIAPFDTNANCSRVVNGKCTDIVYGCTNPIATNYSIDATRNGKCTFDGYPTYVNMSYSTTADSTLNCREKFHDHNKTNTNKMNAFMYRNNRDKIPPHRQWAQHKQCDFYNVDTTAINSSNFRQADDWWSTTHHFEVP